MLTFVMAAAVLTYLVFVFFPVQQSIGEMRRELDEQRQYILGVDNRYVQLNALQQRLADSEEFVQSAQAAAQQSPGLAEFLTAVTEAALTAGVSLDRISPGEVSDGATIREHKVELSVQGSFRQFFTFLGELEYWSGSLWIIETTIEPTSEFGEILECRVVLAVFTDLPGNSD